MSRKKKAFTIYLPERLMERLDKWLEEDELQTSRTRFIEIAVKNELDRRETPQSKELEYAQ